jgi:uncharacterized membrane protein
MPISVLLAQSDLLLFTVIVYFLPTKFPTHLILLLLGFASVILDHQLEQKVPIVKDVH